MQEVQDNNERMHSSLNYLTPRDYYRGDPDELLRIREEKIRMGRTSRKKQTRKIEREV